jgi:coenzyme F420-reducing hydrogenase beta subunit
MFTPFCCTVCNDYTSELADITFGDAWLPEFAGDKTGQSMIITRTSFTEEILQRMISKKLIEINKIGREQVIQSQGGFRYKKETLATRRFLLKVMGRKVPLNYQKVSHVKVGGLFLEIRAYLWSLVARTRYFKLLLGVRAFLIKVRKFSKFSLMIL